MSNGPKLIAFLVEGGDLFKQLTATWHNKPLDAVTPTEQQHTEGITYGLMYGLSVEKLADNLNLPVANAKTLKTQFLNSFKTLGNFCGASQEPREEAGSVTTMGGRSRPAPSSDRAMRQSAAGGTPGGQLGDSRIGRRPDEGGRCCAMRRALAQKGIGARLIAQLHDEVLFEVHEDDADRCAEGRARVHGDDWIVLRGEWCRNCLRCCRWR